MGLETRKRGGTYYYRKRRIGTKVVSEYVGSGDLAYLANAYDERERTRQEAKRRQLNKEQSEAKAEDDMLAELSMLLDQLVKRYLEGKGYHQHKGQWRRKRKR